MRRQDARARRWRPGRWRAVAAVVAILAGANVHSYAPGSSGWRQRSPSLEYGPHGVGFTVIEALDSTRSFRPLRDHRGRLAAETARPVQLTVWYPASVESAAPRMRAGEFRLLRETELDYGARVTPAQAARLRSEFIRTAVRTGAEAAGAEQVWDARTPAVRDAPPAPGKHPTVLHVGAAGVSNPLLPSYLASHGFVVAAFPSNGRMTAASLEFSPNALTLDTGVDDAGFAASVLERMPYADVRRLGVAAFSGSSLVALLWTMRDMRPGALVTVEGWERYRRGADTIGESVLYDPNRIRVPFLMIERGPDERSPQYAKVHDVVGSLRYADLTRVAFRDAAHADFLSHVSFGHTPHHPEIYESSARMIRLFLEATLGGNERSARRLTNLRAPRENPFFTIVRTPSIGSVPTEEELFRLAEIDPAAAAAAYRDGARIVEGHQLFREAVLTRAAIFARSADTRAAIMQIVTDAYPRSAGAWARLGEALVEAGRPEVADAALRRGLEAVERDPSLDATQRAEWRDRITRLLDREPLVR